LTVSDATAHATEPRLHFVPCLHGMALHRMAYWEWGDAANPRVLVCAHGLTRQGRDFDTLARALCSHYRVVCPDVIGRGRSDWLDDPMGYAVPTYVADMVTLLARLNAETVDWVGTSMGGLIGMGVAGLKGSPLRRLVLNDVGPSIDPRGLMRIAAYTGQPARWPSLQAAADALWQISQTFGPHTPEQWLALSEPQVKTEGDALVPRADPGIGKPMALLTPEIMAAAEAGAWALYDSLRLPTLVLRGAESDLLAPATAQAMTERGPRAQLVQFAEVGHAPTLVAADQVQAVRSFLLGP
jgi:pimeloyl-ACP methyl ester carboxylesterase